MQRFWPNHLIISLYTVYYSYSPLADCFKTKPFLTCPTHFLCCQKMTTSECSWRMGVSYTFEKLMGRRSQKRQNLLTHPTHFLSDRINRSKPKMKQNDPEPKNVPNFSFWWWTTFGDMLGQQHGRLKLSTVKRGRYYCRTVLICIDKFLQKPDLDLKYFQIFHLIKSTASWPYASVLGFKLFM